MTEDNTDTYQGSDFCIYLNNGKEFVLKNIDNTWTMTDEDFYPPLCLVLEDIHGKKFNINLKYIVYYGPSAMMKNAITNENDGTAV